MAAGVSYILRQLVISRILNVVIIGCRLVSCVISAGMMSLAGTLNVVTSDVSRLVVVVLRFLLWQTRVT